MKSQAISRDLQFECFDGRMCLNFFSSFRSQIFCFMITSLMLFCVFSLEVRLVVKFPLYFLIHTHSKNSNHLDLTVQKFKNLVVPFEGALILVPQNFVKFYLFVLAYTENFICLASVVKKFEFWRIRFGWKPPFWYLKLWSNFLFLLYLLTSNTSCF